MNIINNCCGIYKIKNLINGKYYVGSSHNIKNRIKKHFNLLKRNSHHSTYLQNSYNKYGADSFDVEVLEITPKSDLLFIEQKYLDSIVNWENVYNISRIATGCNYNLSTHPNQINIRKKMSLANKGKHTKPFYINNIRYELLADASAVFNVDIKTISNRIKNWKNKDYYYEGIPKIGEYHESIKEYFYNPKIEKKRYYCKCGIEIKKHGKFCDSCRKTRRSAHVYDNPVIINSVEYDTAKEASRILEIEYCTLLWRIKTNTITFKDYSFKSSPKDITKLISKEDINKKISEKNMGNKGSNHKPFKINGIEYESLRIASKTLQMSRSNIDRKLKSKIFKDFSYI